MDNVLIGRFIADLREQRGMTQQELADILGLSNKTISKWESGMGSPDISNLSPLADALGITVDELLKAEKRKEASKVNASTDEKAERERQKFQRAIILLAACMGAVLGILAYNFGWLG